MESTKERVEIATRPFALHDLVKAMKLGDIVEVPPNCIREKNGAFFIIPRSPEEYARRKLILEAERYGEA